MRFGHCSDCGTYNFLEDKGLCRTCIEEAAEVRLRIDRLKPRLYDPSVLETIGTATTADPRVTVSRTPDTWHDDLDFLPDAVILYTQENEYRYASYAEDTLAERVGAAVADALDDAVAAYEGEPPLYSDN